MNYEKIGEFIATKRKEKNLTQKELAKKIGVTDKAVSRWERGLGCPDVSILELLSKELDVSILELLKGRKIENEVIKVTEADDYIKDTFKVSKDLTKNNIKKFVSNVIFSLVVFISIIFIILSALNYIKANEKISLGATTDDEASCISAKPYLKMKENIKIIKENKGVLTTEERDELVKYYESLMNYYSKSFFCILNKDKKYTANEIVIEFLEDIYSPTYPSGIMTNIINLYKNHNFTDWYITELFLGRMYSRAMLDNAFIFAYQGTNQEYFKLTSSQSITSFSAYFPPDEGIEYYISLISRDNVRIIETYNKILEDIMRQGGINEE